MRLFRHRPRGDLHRLGSPVTSDPADPWRGGSPAQRSAVGSGSKLTACGKAGASVRSNLGELSDRHGARHLGCNTTMPRIRFDFFPLTLPGCRFARLCTAQPEHGGMWRPSTSSAKRGLRVANCWRLAPLLHLPCERFCHFGPSYFGGRALCSVVAGT